MTPTTTTTLATGLQEFQGPPKDFFGGQRHQEGTVYTNQIVRLPCISAFVRKCSSKVGSDIGLWGFAPPNSFGRPGRCEADMLYAAQEVSVYVPRYEAEGLFSVSSEC